MKRPSCDILLATYNGEAFIADQLDSLLCQTQDDFRLIIRDDGSTDGLLAIVQSYETRFGGRMVILDDRAPTGSAMRNFALLMAHSTADHILFCDQDDVWLPDRVELCRRLLTEAENKYGPSIPIFAFSDLVVVDQDLNPIAESFWEFKKIDPNMGNSLPLSLITSPILGCASGINRSLLQLSLPINDNAVMHDWWMLHVAQIFGKVVFSPEKTVLYRQHGKNVSRQKRVSLTEYAKSRSPFGRVRHGLRRKVAHARALLENYGDRMPAKVRQMLEDLTNIERRGFFGRRMVLLRWKLIYPDLRRNVMWLLGV